MYTFNQMWGVITPDEAMKKIVEQREAAGIKEPQNLEEQAISLVGTDIYERTHKGLHRKAMGTPLQRAPFIHHQEIAREIHIQQQLFQCQISRHSHRWIYCYGRYRNN